MRLWEPIAVAAIAAVAAAATTADAGSCRTKKHQNCFDSPATLNFATVPEISKEIVSGEAPPPQPKTTIVEAPPITTYTGPMVGVSSMAHAPTVGYYWSLEPDSGK
jgi:hypothetical protein